MQLANWCHKTTVAAGGQERVSVAFQGLCLMCIVQRHDLTSGRDREANRRPSDGHHARTHARTHAHHPGTVFDHADLHCVALRDVLHVRQWLYRANWLRSLIQNTAGFFLHQNVYSKILYKHEINLFSRISVMNYENVLQPKTSCKITLMCTWGTKLGTENWLENGNKALTV